jgi:hypothetical protein
MQPRSLQPHILTLRTLLTPRLDNLPRRHHPPRMFLQARRRNPPGRVFRVRLDQRVEQHPRALDVPDLRIGLQDDAVQRGEVAFRVDGGGGPARRGPRYLVQLEREDLVTGLADLDKVG